ncbi:MAG: hypothetical protein ACOC5K_03440, partial [Chloroflexota bacterium]
MASAGDRVRFEGVEGASEVFTQDFLDYMLALHDEFNDRVQEARRGRAALLEDALRNGKLPGPLPPSEATTTEWNVPDMPDELRKPGIEISGPASITPMFINALNPTQEGNRAEGDLDDDEDSAGHRLVDTVRAAINRRDALRGTLEMVDEERGRRYQLQAGELPFFMHRERGLHLDEPDFQIDGQPVSATLLGTALTLFHAGQEHARQGKG